MHWNINERSRKLRMRKVTCKVMTDDDINIDIVRKRLSDIAEAITVSNKNNLTDINVICEEIFGQILNKLYDINLISMSANVSGNFIAVDLVDYDNRIAYQVTSRSDRGKIDRTIKTFNDNGIYKDIDELYFLILDLEKHTYYGSDILKLKNGKNFSYTKNIMNFSKLIDEIKKKNELINNFVVEIYDCITMVYDSGRLRYFSIVKNTELLKQTTTDDFEDIRCWEKGYGDVHLSAFIPLSYEEELCCLLQIRQHNLSGVSITLNEEILLADYFVSEKEFEAKHIVGRYEDEDEIFMQIENMRIKLNAHSAYHIYKLFEEYKEEYLVAQRQIENILGVEGLRKEGNKYFLMTIDKMKWEEILFFAKDHEYYQEGDEIEWNIFDYKGNTSKFRLVPNDYGKVKGDIFTTISASCNELDNDKINVYWEPGYIANEDCMNCFDNIVKWKADYTMEWINNKLLEKAHVYYKRYNGKFSYLRKILNKLFQRI